MKYSHLTCDENGYVRGFAYHDGFLDGVLARDSEVHLALRSTQGESRVLRLRQVVSLHVEAFREGNIVLNIRILSGRRVSLDAEVRSMISKRLYVDATTLSPDASVLILEASYGADIVAVCGEAVISEIGARLSVC